MNLTYKIKKLGREYDNHRSIPTALHLYRMKDNIEKAFGNLKELLNRRRLLAKSEKGLDGKCKLFVAFVALILVSCLNHRMKEADLICKFFDATNRIPYLISVKKTWSIAATIPNRKWITLPSLKDGFVLHARSFRFACQDFQIFSWPTKIEKYCTRLFV